MSKLYLEALERFHKTLQRARETGLLEPTAMTLSTAWPEGRISSRMVLLKSCDERGLVFYTNRGSRKGKQLEENPRAALCFHWDPLREQVLIEGSVARLSDEESDAYWRTRPRDSQVGAWASRQSRPLESRAVFLADIARYTAQYVGRAIPRPPCWGGFLVQPIRIEFWKSEAFRLHFRSVYTKDEADDSWSVQTLYP